jgi:hypothetical protein
MIWLSLATSGIAVVSTLTLIVFPGSFSWMLQVLPIGMTVITVSKIPSERRRQLLRELRLEIWLAVFVCGGLFGMAVFAGLVPQELRRSIGLFWFVVPLMFLGVLVVRILRSIAIRAIQR